MALTITLTDAGRAALRNTDGDGTRAVRIAAMGVTATAFAPGEPLPDETKRLSTLAGGATAPDTLHVTVSDSGSDVYTVRGFGFYLDDGTLLGSYGQAEPIVEKSARSIMQLALDCQFLAVDATAITVGDTNFLNPAATPETLGVVKLATDDVAMAGADRQRAMTPAADKAALDDRLGKEAPTSFVKRLLALTSAALFRDTLEIKSAALKDEGAGHGLDADRLDGQEGDYYRDWRNLTNRPASFLLAGQMIVTAALAPPPGTLVCNGAAVSRTAYPALFAAIGTRYGAGDGNTTFNLPNFGDGDSLRAALDASRVGVKDAGAVLSHAHAASAGAVGDHAHPNSIGAAGGHSHGASTRGAGGHGHNAWTDQQGYHQHSGGTAGAGGHTHLQADGTVYNGGGQVVASYRGDSNPHLYGDRRNVDGVGDHGHVFTTDPNGSHGHNVGIGGVGDHAHIVDVAGVGDHTHPIGNAGAGAHSHPITVNAAGGGKNIAAGISMLFCIAY